MKTLAKENTAVAGTLREMTLEQYAEFARTPPRQPKRKN